MTKTLTEQIVNVQNEIDGVFDEVVKLEKQIAIATKALKYYDGVENIIIDWKLLTGQEAGTASKALKEMEGIK